ncbi:PREDICTED: leucine zipper protein 4 isoform X2 [Chinchilla lanigera]|uniref:leucine zipper protein 4 isoform X2 n=1 Tax=Chinchilla lanigera TaxID=34839 RepID=UPI00038E9A5B|nr:PREDICTED: leucine zipper protein 4 isoform X2 [Chinchilla lanigera]
MATGSNFGASWKETAGFPDRKTASFLDMSLGDGSSEEENDKTEIHVKEPASGQQSEVCEQHLQRGHARNIEKRNDDRKPYKEYSASRSGGRPLSQQPLQKQEKYDHDYKVQSERKQLKSEVKEHHLERKQDNLESSRAQFRRSHGQSERSRGYIERSHRRSEHSHGRSERYHVYSERYHVYSERSRSRSDRSYGHSERYRGYAELPYGHSSRYHDQSGRIYGQSEGYQRYLPRYLPEGRFGTSFKTDATFDRKFTVYKRNDYFYKRMSERNYSVNVNQKVAPEHEHNSYEAERNYTRYMNRGDDSFFLRTRHTGEGSPHQPRGVFLKYNFKALGNQTNLSLHERFSKLEALRKPRGFINY